MELAIFIFFIVLLLPGLWLVLDFRREIKDREWGVEQQRIEHERIAAMATMRRRSYRHSVQARTLSAVETLQPAETTNKAAPARNDVSLDARRTPADIWREMDTSHLDTAFENFLNATSHPCDTLTTSQISEAFEKFSNTSQRRAYV
jgi:hypothetical protein